MALNLKVDIPELEPDPVLLEQLSQLSRASTPHPVESGPVRTLVAAVTVAVVAAFAWLTGTLPGVASPFEDHSAPPRHAPAQPDQDEPQGEAADAVATADAQHPDPARRPGQAKTPTDQGNHNGRLKPNDGKGGKGNHTGQVKPSNSNNNGDNGNHTGQVKAHQNQGNHNGQVKTHENKGNHTGQTKAPQNDTKAPDDTDDTGDSPGGRSPGGGGQGGGTKGGGTKGNHTGQTKPPQGQGNGHVK